MALSEDIKSSLGMKEKSGTENTADKARSSVAKVSGDVKSALGLKEKSGAERMADKAKSGFAKMTDDVKGALGMRPKTDKHYDYGLAALRLALGIIALNGISTLAGLAGAGASLGKLGIPLSGLVAFFIGLLEVAAGLAILLGVLARASGILIALGMAIAMLLAGIHEPEALFLLCGIAIALTGPGKYSLEEKIAGGRDSVLHRI